MKYISRILLLLILGYSCFSALILVQIGSSHLHSPVKSKWVLVWEDDFLDTTLDTDQWVVLERSGGYNELYHYQNEIAAFTQDNIRVENGYLLLTSEKREWIGEDIFHPGQTIAGQYTSGQIVTKYAYTWGRYEIRAKLPSGQGLLPYVNLYPYEADSLQTILIIGMLGYDPYYLYMGSHLGANQQLHFLNNGIFNRIHGPDYSADFHTYVVEIEPERIRWYVDDVKVFQTKENIPRVPLYLNLGTVAG